MRTKPQALKHTRGRLARLPMILAVAVMAAALLPPVSVRAADTANARRARQLVDEAYNLVFGAAGASFQYSVNIIGLYKAAGSITMKGKKSRFFEQRYSAWCDGEDYYKVDNKRKTVEIYKADSPKKDKYSGKFTFSLGDFNYKYSEHKGEYAITLEAKPRAQGNIRHAQVVIDKATKVPKRLRIKVLFFWTTIKISNFKAGGINDAVFTFPRARFGSYKTTDRRGE